MSRSFDGILRAILTSRVYEVARETSLDVARRLSGRVENTVWLKREDQQPVFSFKIRGAYNRMTRLSASERKVGVITASAGNHAQGVVTSAKHLAIRAVIVMPKTTPAIKVEAVGALDAEVVLAGDHYSDAQQQCDRLAEETGLTFVHPFDDPLVIAGQGTIADEIVRQHPRDLTAIFVPVGGGGLLAGIGAYIKSVMPEVRVIGVEPVDSDAMNRALKAGHPVNLENPGLFADGVAVRQVGKHTFSIVQATVHEIVTVNNDEICGAIKDIFDDTRTIVEPAGALAVAGMKAYVERTGERGKHFVAQLSGANMNFDRLRFVAERAELGESREALFVVTIPERPGSFRQFCAAIGPRVITEFNYRLNDRDRADVFVGLSVRSREDDMNVKAGLLRKGYEATDLSDNELAKRHVRYMVGGHARDVKRERLCRFEFPERPGALLQFLDTLGGRWNISLFHYRNHGLYFVRVLAAIMVQHDEDETV